MTPWSREELARLAASGRNGGFCEASLTQQEPVAPRPGRRRHGLRLLESGPLTPGIPEDLFLARQYEAPVGRGA
jgi:hypothetical protein